MCGEKPVPFTIVFCATSGHQKSTAPEVLKPSPNDLLHSYSKRLFNYPGICLQNEITGKLKMPFSIISLKQVNTFWLVVLPNFYSA